VTLPRLNLAALGPIEGHMGRRTLLLIAALVVAALGTTGVFLYVNGVDDRAQAGVKIDKILVAKALIPAGTTAQQASDQTLMDTQEYLHKSIVGLPVMSDISGIATKVAVSDIQPGEPILATQFGDLTDTSALHVPDGKVAVSVQLGDPARVAGFITPGNDVAILLSGAEAAGGANAGQAATRVLLSPVQVIAAGSTTLVPTTTTTGQTQQTEQVAKAILTLAVDQKEAQKIVFAQGNGTMYFALLGKGTKIDLTDPGATAKNLFAN
jgi:pilus assembly protein CpaB